MKYQVMMQILFRLLAQKKVSATELAGENGVSIRSVYRYIDELTVTGIPIDVQPGRGGGIYISDSYKLPVGFMTRAEYEAALTAMKAMQEQLPSEDLKSAIGKIASRCKSEKTNAAVTGDVIVDSSSWGDYRFDEKLRLLQNAVHEKESVEIDYVSRTGEHTKRTIEPHVLVFKQNVWYVYAYCRLRRQFRLFKAGRIRTMRQTGKTFVPKIFSRDDIPLDFTQDREERTNVKLEISPALLPDAQEWLGVECIRKEEERFLAEISLPKGEGLIRKILGFGGGVKVLYPPELKEEVRREAIKIAEENE